MIEIFQYTPRAMKYRRFYHCRPSPVEVDYTKSQATAVHLSTSASSAASASLLLTTISPRLTPYLSWRLTVPPMVAKKTTSKTGSTGGAL